ncbi:MAG: DUF4445 domain-containing protein, partial [Candidatus Electrothrix sp. AR3]|nr:DUF4445 domain-containing protein [Candidatus Electrothrix sp. AR3]
MRHNKRGYPLLTNKIPLTILLLVKAAPPSLQDNTADIDRLKAALAASLPNRLIGYQLHIPFARLALIAARFRAAGFKGYAVMHVLFAQLELIDFMPEKPQLLPAIALDLGSTHLEASLLDLLTGTPLAHGNRLNLQVQYGADILTRIHYAEKKDGLEMLQQAVISSINSLITPLCRDANLSSQDILALSIAGNTTMIHLLLGLKPNT